jgi:tRNA pseudouridine synthase
VFTIGAGARAARWVRTRVHGQSFLLNQIRKMIGLAVAVYRGTAPAGAVERALDPCIDVSTPMAPELGLFLVECKFDLYNEKFGNEREVLNVGEWADDVDAFELVRDALCMSCTFCLAAPTVQRGAGLAWHAQLLADSQDAQKARATAFYSQLNCLMCCLLARVAGEHLPCASQARHRGGGELPLATDGHRRALPLLHLGLRRPGAQAQAAAAACGGGRRSCRCR